MFRPWHMRVARWLPLLVLVYIFSLLWFCCQFGESFQDLTNESFLTEIPEALQRFGVSRLYRTGDLGRLEADGSLHFIGRKGRGQAWTFNAEISGKGGKMAQQQIDVLTSSLVFPLQKGRTRARYEMVWGSFSVAEIGLGHHFL